MLLQAHYGGNFLEDEPDLSDLVPISPFSSFQPKLNTTEILNPAGNQIIPLDQMMTGMNGKAYPVVLMACPVDA